MNEYLLTCKQPDGHVVTERVDASSGDEAVELLRRRGCSEIVLHSDDVSAVLLKASKYEERLSPRDLIAIRNAGGYLARVKFWIGKSYRTCGATTIALLAIFLFRRASVWPWSNWDYLVLFLLIFPFLFALATPLLFSARSFRRLQEAISWGRWDEVLRKLASLRNRIPPDAAAFYEAQALAGLGRTDEGLRVWARFSGAPQLPDWMHWARLSEIYATAQDREAALAALERAAVLAPENPVVLLSLARTVLLFHKDTCRARVLLNAARSHELSDVMVSMLAMVEGMLGVEEGRAHEAIGRLEDSLTGITPLAHNPATGPGIANIHAYLALAHAAVRDLKSAEEHFRLAEPRLRALRQKEMLSRCHDILGLPAGCAKT